MDKKSVAEVIKRMKDMAKEDENRFKKMGMAVRGKCESGGKAPFLRRLLTLDSPHPGLRVPPRPPPPPPRDGQ
jgi:hypothetical protein